MNRLKIVAITSLAGLPHGGMARADQPIDAGHHLQPAVTPVMRDIVWLDDFLHVLMIAIVVMVVGLMAYALTRFSAKSNPTPRKFTHNTVLEVIWTAVPVIILIIIAIPSLKLLFLQMDIPEADVTIKATGNEWYWTYEYPDEEIEFDATMIGKGVAVINDEVRAKLKEAGYRPEEFLLATDERVVVPVNAVVHVLVTATNVIHGWAIPAFGSKVDGMPGRMNETWFKATEIGTYFGQCSELCGMEHAYMPIVVEVVSEDDYETWVLETASRDVEPTTDYALSE